MHTHTRRTALLIIFLSFLFCRKVREDAEIRLTKLRAACEFSFGVYFGSMLAGFIAGCIEFYYYIMHSIMYIFYTMPKNMIVAVYNYVVMSVICVLSACGMFKTVVYFIGGKFEKVVNFIGNIIFVHTNAVFVLWESVGAVMLIATVGYVTYKVNEYMQVGGGSYYYKHNLAIASSM